MNGPGPGTETQHSHDEGPDELVGRVVHWSTVPQLPCVVHKTLNVLRKKSKVILHLAPKIGSDKKFIIVNVKAY